MTRRQNIFCPSCHICNVTFSQMTVCNQYGLKLHFLNFLNSLVDFPMLNVVGKRNWIAASERGRACGNSHSPPSFTFTRIVPGLKSCTKIVLVIILVLLKLGRQVKQARLPTKMAVALGPSY